MTTITFKNRIQKFQNDKTIILEYLYENNAIPQAIETFQNTWQAYLLTR